MIRATFGVFAFLTAVTGLAYPLLTTVVAHAAFPRQARGSLLERGGKTVGSELLGQEFAGPGCFWGRPSETGGVPCDGMASQGSNLGPTNPALAAKFAERVRRLRAAHPGQAGPIPADLLTASGSGLDPHLSPAAAEFQVPRVAKARGLPADAVRRLVARHTLGPQLGMFGEQRVNVLRLNLALDEGASR